MAISPDVNGSGSQEPPGGQGDAGAPDVPHGSPEAEPPASERPGAFPGQELLPAEDEHEGPPPAELAFLELADPIDEQEDIEDDWDVDQTLEDVLLAEQDAQMLALKHRRKRLTLDVLRKIEVAARLTRSDAAIARSIQVPELLLKKWIKQHPQLRQRIDATKQVALDALMEREYEAALEGDGNARRFLLRHRDPDFAAGRSEVGAISAFRGALSGGVGSFAGIAAIAGVADEGEPEPPQYEYL